MERLTTVFNTEQEEFHSQKLNVSLVHEIDKDILTTNISCICFCSNKSVSRVKREEILSCLFFYYSFILKIFLLCISSLFLPNDALHVICEWEWSGWRQKDKSKKNLRHTHRQNHTRKRILQTHSFISFWRQRPSHRETRTTGSFKQFKR